nr:8847_t:CDS:2 [Entrophospora candida]
MSLGLKAIVRGVPREEKLCSNCKNDKDVVRLTSCDACYLNYHYREEITKCRYHSKYCLSCSNKIPEYSYYCSEHSNSCLTCAIRIDSGRTYCSVHQEHQEQENLKTLVKQKTSLSNPQEGYDKYGLASVKNKASSLRSELNGDNPILAIHPSANSYVSFNSLITSPYVIKNGLPYSHEPGFFSDSFGAPTSAESHLKPLDIV